MQGGQNLQNERGLRLIRDAETGEAVRLVDASGRTVVENTSLASRPSPAAAADLQCAVLQKDRVQRDIPTFEERHPESFPARGEASNQPALANGSVRRTDPGFAQADANHNELVAVFTPADPADRRGRTPTRPKNTAWQQDFVDYVRSGIHTELRGAGSTISSEGQVKFLNVENDITEEEARRCSEGPGPALPGVTPPGSTSPTIPTAPPRPQPPTSPIDDAGGGGGPGGGGGGIFEKLLPQLLESLLGKQQGGGQGGSSSGQPQPTTPLSPVATPLPDTAHSSGFGEQIEGFLRNGIPKSLIEQVVLSIMNLFLNTLSGQLSGTTVPGGIPETIVGG